MAEGKKMILEAVKYPFGAYPGGIGKEMLGSLQRSVNILVSFAFFTGIKVAVFKSELRA